MKDKTLFPFSLSFYLSTEELMTVSIFDPDSLEFSIPDCIKAGVVLKSGVVLGSGSSNSDSESCSETLFDYSITLVQPGI